MGGCAKRWASEVVRYSRWVIEDDQRTDRTLRASWRRARMMLKPRAEAHGIPSQLEILSRGRSGPGRPRHGGRHREPRAAGSEALGRPLVPGERHRDRCPNAQAPRHRRRRPDSPARDPGRGPVAQGGPQGSRRPLQACRRGTPRVDRRRAVDGQRHPRRRKAHPRKPRQAGRQEHLPGRRLEHRGYLRRDEAQRGRDRARRVGRRRGHGRPHPRRHDGLRVDPRSQRQAGRGPGARRRVLRPGQALRGVVRRGRRVVVV